MSLEAQTAPGRAKPGETQEIVVEMADVVRHYKMRGETIKACDHVSLQVRKGEFLALAGPSGSGKSTCLNLIGGLDSPDSGLVSVDGRPLSKLTGRDRALLRRDRIGFVFQAYNLIPVLTVLENVEYVMLLQGVDRKARYDRAKAILEEVGLGDKLNRRSVELSGGQQQRVAVARALAAQPAIILADEPTANLDSVTGAALLEMMRKLNQHHGVTFIFSTHDKHIMAAASRLVMLRDGKIESIEQR